MLRRPVRRCAPLALLAAAALACGPAADPSPGDATRVLHQHRDARFELKVERQTGPERIVAEVVPRGDYHLSLEYPSRFELAGRLAQPREAADERSEARLAFVAELPADPAVERVSGRLRFGVCLREELCEPISHDFEAQLN